MGPVWRHMRTDRSAGRDAAGTRHGQAGADLRRTRTGGYIAVFLVLTVLDAVLVVVSPLLIKRIVDDGIAKENVQRRGGPGRS